MQKTTLAKVNDATLRVYVVWVPMLAPDFEFTVKRATTWVPDQRASHYWDRDGVLARGYARVLQMEPGAKAWDVYLVYGREVEWRDTPPAPYSFMDKIGIERGRPLDGEQLAIELKALSEGTK